MSHQQVDSVEADDRQDSVWSLTAFWIVGFIGTALIAAVLIAPKWEERQALRDRVRYWSAQCTYLADANDHLQRAIDAFQNDPEFHDDVARSALGYVAPDEERLPAPTRSWIRPKPTEIEHEPDPLDPFVRLFSQDIIVRRTALISAAVFVVFGLAFFNSKSVRRKATG